MTDDDERAAREWLQNKADHAGHPYSNKCRTILRLLNRPVMPRPEDFPGDVMVTIADKNCIPYANFRGMYRDLHAHLTAPPEPKKKEIWAVYASDGVCIGWHPARSIAKDWVTDPARHRLVHFVEAADDDR